MENYKQKYEQAFERAKGMYEQGMMPERIEYIFPELKESEDEKMLREIKRYIKEQGKKPTGLPNGTVAVADMLAWLEKQCEQKFGKCKQEAKPNGGIVYEDFNGGEGFYKLNLDYLNKKQVEEIEELVRMWNKELKTSNEDNCRLVKPSEELEKFIQDLIEKYPVNKESVPNDSLNSYYQGLRFGVLQGAQWQKEQFVNKSCQWLKDNLMNFLSITINDREALDVDYNELIYEFKKAMEDK